MGKNSYYFDHDYNARNDQKILSLRAEMGWEGYGLFFATCEVLCEAGGYISKDGLDGIAFGLFVPLQKYTEFMDVCIKSGLFTEDGGKISNNRILEHVENRNRMKQKGKYMFEKRKEKDPAYAALCEAKKAKKEQKGIPDYIHIPPPPIPPPDRIIKEGGNPLPPPPFSEKPLNEQFGTSIVVTDAKMMEDVLTGQQYVEQSCIGLNCTEEEFLAHVKQWVALKAALGDYRYSINSTRLFCQKDFKQQKPSQKKKASGSSDWLYEKYGIKKDQ